MNKSITNAKVIQWLLLLQEFDITIIDRPRKDNVVSYFLSQLSNASKIILVEDHFPDEHPLAISTNIPWYADISNYLVSIKLPSHLSRRK